MTQPTCKSNLPITGFVRLKTVLKFFPVSKSTWWRGVKEGKFPQPIKLTKRTTAWRATDIHMLLRETAKHQGVAEFIEATHNLAPGGQEHRNNNKK